MKPSQLIHLAQISIAVGAAALVLSACTSPKQGGTTLQNQPTGSDVIDQLSFESNQNNAASESGTMNSTTTQLELQQTGPTMKQLSDYPENPATQATIHTSKGDVVIELYREQAPLTTINFITLANEGFYNGIVFHRVIPGFMAQVGDPLTKDPSKQAQWGSGGPGYVIADEFGPGLKHDKAGVVSMANAGPNTGGSQFFITHEETPWLDGKHAIFGQVTAGMDVVLKLEVGDTITGIELQ